MRPLPCRYSEVTDVIEPFRLSVPQADLDDLAHRLTAVRWPDPVAVADRRPEYPYTFAKECFVFEKNKA